MRNRIRFIFAAALLVFLMGGTSGCVVPLLGAGMALDATVFKEANANRASRMAAASVRKAENALLAAADKGRYQKVRDLLRRRVNPNARDENGETALMKAARKGHVRVVEPKREIFRTPVSVRDVSYTSIRLLSNLDTLIVRELLKASPLRAQDLQRIVSVGIEAETLSMIASGLSFIEKLKLKYRSYVKIGDYVMDGWSDRLPFYLFKCHKHGYQVNYPSIYSSTLVCPVCLRDLRQDDHVNLYNEVRVEETQVV